MTIVAAVDCVGVGQDAGMLAGCGEKGVLIQNDLLTAIEQSQADVMLDFTVPGAVRQNIELALSQGLPCVVGTTGLSDQDLQELDELSRRSQAPVFVASNFAITAVLMMRFAAEAAHYLPEYEVIEIHNERKADAPSGTALTTLSMMEQQRQTQSVGSANRSETVPGSRGGDFAGSRVHSLRIPGVVAIQEVIFGAAGQTLTIRHDATGRECFWPGVALALRSIGKLEGLVFGLEKLM